MRSEERCRMNFFSRERLNADLTAADSFCAKFQEFIDEEENLIPNQIYNGDETGFYWKCLPTKTLASRKEKLASGHKSSKERITIRCCGNASGDHKMKLLMIGKAKKPRSFKGTESNKLPVVYFNQKGAWMTMDIFLRWFHEHFVPEVRNHLQVKGLTQKAVLLLDNASSHPDEGLLASDDGLITSKFLPPNVTAAIQPMDQGVISAMKRHYRSELSKNLIHEVITLPNFWKLYSLLDAVYGISAAWSKVKSSTLSRSWRKIIPLDEQSSSDIQEEYDYSMFEQGNELEGFENLDEGNLEDWFQSDACEPGFQYLTDEDIVINCVVKSNSDDSTDAQDVLNNGNTISHPTVLQSAKTLLYYMGQRGFDYDNITAVRKICVDIRQEMNKQQKQRRIADFFK
ncbi:Jerky -like [Araneus ventricosus]|uniref:Jerky-like n=1 Tax=Araneus ventricosus TaxID=182803 RepID=A0A4Y2EUZ6_ARAVE|nr:Jerky -like [Araneus ventricosus]